MGDVGTLPDILAALGHLSKLDVECLLSTASRFDLQIFLTRSVGVFRSESLGLRLAQPRSLRLLGTSKLCFALLAGVKL
jgi:hypothetical protein